MEKYTYDSELFSDLFKDVNGFRPRDHEFYSTNDPDVKQEIWDSYIASIEEENLRIELSRTESIKKFNGLIKKTINLGAGNFKTAVRWILDGAGVMHKDRLALEEFLYNSGISNTSLAVRIKKIY